jgi:hypothetical protein
MTRIIRIFADPSLLIRVYLSQLVRLLADPCYPCANYKSDYQKIAAPDVAVVEPPEHLKRAIIMKPAQVLRCNERAAINVCQVDYIDPPGLSHRKEAQRVVCITYQDLHPGRSAVNTIASGISLR